MPCAQEHGSEKKAVPRFASFKPQSAPPPDNDRPTKLPRERESEDRPRHRSKHHSRPKSRHSHRSRSRERQDDPKHSHRDRKEAGRYDKKPTRAPTPSRSPVKEPTEDLSDLYVVDRKGDKFNLIYGTIHRYSVPRYYRIGRGRVLGLPPNYRIDRDTVGENEIVVKPEAPRTDTSKARANKLLSATNRLTPRLLRVRPTLSTNDPIKSSDDFVPLKVFRRKDHQDELGESGTDDEKYGYRSIYGKLKHDEGLPSDLEPTSDTDVSSEEAVRQDPDTDIKRRNVELSRNVERDSSDVEVWMQLIDHQETVLRGSEKQSKSLTSAEQKSLADIKHTLYEKALKKVGQGAGRDRLLIGLLEEGSKIWDTQKLLRQWRSILKSNSHYISLWMKYLDFRQTEFLNFTHDRCLATFTECLSLNKASPDNPEKARVQAYLFLRLTLFLREAGFMEQATGLWQATLELTFFHPQGLDIYADANSVLSAFTEFWDSETLRIGDIGAKGWRNGNTNWPDPIVFEPKCGLNSSLMFESWAACERERMMNAHLPARSVDEPEDDPYRVILVSDLEGFLPLVSLPSWTTELVDSLLYFCQLPPVSTVRNLRTTGHWMGDSFLRNDVTGASYVSLDDWLPTSGTKIEGISSTAFPHQLFIHDFDTYFSDPESWFPSFSTWAKGTSSPTYGVVRDWVRRTLRLLVETMPSNEDLAEYTVALEFVCNPKEAKKYAKSLLKKQSSSLRLYNAYALLERRTGNDTAADHVRATAISMSKSFATEQQVDSIRLWYSWIWELLEARNIGHAAYLLVCMPQNSIDLKSFPNLTSKAEFSPTNLLKIRTYLSDAQENAIANQNPSIIKACTSCHAILLYLTNAQDFDGALEAYILTTNRLSLLNSSAEPFVSYTMQLLHQSRAKLLHYHLRTSTLYKPASIRTLLTESITLFPHNTIFLSLFAWNESRFRIEERVRDIMRDVTTTQAYSNSSSSHSSSQVPITTHLFSIYAELNRPLYAGSTLHSARAAFERAISDHHNQDSTTSSSASPSTNSSITLWTLYIYLELSRNEITRAKNVFYRAMRACPWSKDILMLAFTHLRDDVVRARPANGGDGSLPQKGEGMNFHELRHVYNVLAEKELRIHIDIERELDELATSVEVAKSAPISMPEDAESGDEVMQM
ncbi:NRDE-2, necessary for RNA interference-domain-containing protein [Aspergillus pseudoustus]|uniref:NRDE-2, necessary for RNA interference-domain-containing protein n=1 Tax=Aspergillus pseudoustus TaxID=1810923 RepID=A0ABR4K032_9EURO